MEQLHIISNIHNYQIDFYKDLSFWSEVIKEENCIYFFDKNVYDLYKSELPLKNESKIIFINAIEENKTYSYAEELLEKIVLFKPNKKTVFISIGGGITQDLTGFITSIFYRGMKWIYIPTTLLAQADSCMGSKTSLNFKKYKNILGTFYPPHQIYISTKFLSTLATEDLYSGMGEVAKLHIMGGKTESAKLIESLSTFSVENDLIVVEFIKNSLKVKWSYMKDDEFDTGKRNLLNYGHCFGHAIETATMYKIPHGQAVIIGIILANKVAVERNLLNSETEEKLSRELLIPLIKSNLLILKELDCDKVVEAMKQDKKRVGTGLPLILVDNKFELFKIQDLTEHEALNTLTNYKNTLVLG